MRPLSSICAVLAGFAVATAVPTAPAEAVGAQFRSDLIEMSAVRPPRGYAELCARRPEICPAQRTGGEVDRVATVLSRMFGLGALEVDAPELTPERYRALQQVNAAVNASIRPVADLGPDLWSFSAVAGDCEEYVLMKREMLARLGWPRAALRITVVRGADYQYHAVLVVSTRGGEFILDNMVQDIVRVPDSSYEFVVSESMVRPGDWVRVRR